MGVHSLPEDSHLRGVPVLEGPRHVEHKAEIGEVRAGTVGHRGAGEGHLGRTHLPILYLKILSSEF
jgi:hypothetical protein